MFATLIRAVVHQPAEQGMTPVSSETSFTELWLPTAVLAFLMLCAMVASLYMTKRKDK